MTNLLIQDIEVKQKKTSIPQIKPGSTVKVHQRIKEGGKERTQIFEGLVIKISHGSGINQTITVRKIVDGIGVEKIFPIFSPTIVKIEIVRVGKVRRSKLYYMREISGKAARLKERIGEKKKLVEAMQEKVKIEEEAKAAIESAEEVKADAAEAKEELKADAAEAKEELKEAEVAAKEAPEDSKEEVKKEEKAE